MKKYKAVVTYRDGYECQELSYSKEAVLDMVKATNDGTMRIFKHRGVDYGPHGKLLTKAELHDGIESITVYEISITNTWDIDPRSL